MVRGGGRPALGGAGRLRAVVIFIDTSAIFALASERDLHHHEARRLFDELLRTERRLVTHSYVLSESMALLHRRLGRGVALAVAVEARRFEVEWVDERLHGAAVDALADAASGVSLVDQVSFLVMRKRAITEAFAFDEDFAAAGFRLYGAVY